MYPGTQQFNFLGINVKNSRESSQMNENGSVLGPWYMMTHEALAKASPTSSPKNQSEMERISGYSGNFVKQIKPQKPGTSTFHLRLQANKLELPSDGKGKQGDVVQVADKGVGGEE